MICDNLSTESVKKQHKNSLTAWTVNPNWCRGITVHVEKSKHTFHSGNVLMAFLNIKHSVLRTVVLCNVVMFRPHPLLHAAVFHSVVTFGSQPFLRTVIFHDVGTFSLQWRPCLSVSVTCIELNHRITVNDWTIDFPHYLILGKWHYQLIWDSLSLSLCLSLSLSPF